MSIANIVLFSSPFPVCFAHHAKSDYRLLTDSGRLITVAVSETYKEVIHMLNRFYSLLSLYEHTHSTTTALSHEHEEETIWRGMLIQA